MTVLRALDGKKNVAQKTAERVLEIARRMDYRRDPALSALAAYRWRKAPRAQGNTLAFLDCDGSAYSRMVLDGARREADFSGYRIDGFRLPPDARGRAALSRTLFHRGVRGLLFGPADTPLSLEGWAWEEFATVTLGSLAHSPPLNGVAPDYFHAAKSAAETLRHAGCTKIGFAIRDELEARTDHRWLGGALAAAPDLSVFPGESFSARALRGWARTSGINGLLTIHADVYSALAPAKIHTLFLNGFECPPGIMRPVLDPGLVGAEGIRVLHHSLLRGEYGLPDFPKVMTLRGRWELAG